MPFPEAPSPMGDVDGSSVVTAAMETSKINYKEIEKDLANTYMKNAEGPMEEIPVLPTGKTSQFPLINMNGNEWLKHALKHVPYATINDLQQCFADSDLKGMKDFWIAELMSGPGRCGGGLCYLSARAFQQTITQRLDEQRLPDFEEARWQFDCMLQYQSMNDKQRHRQSRITKKLMEFFPRDRFFQMTYVPEYNALGRHYGNTGMHSIMNCLPIPSAVDIDGVGYVSPIKIIAYLMANGVPIDNIQIRSSGMPSVEEVLEPGPHQYRVHNVEECRKAVAWKNKVINEYIDAPENSNSKSGAPKHLVVICVYMVRWKDGFGASSVKNNRPSVDVTSLTVSPPKSLVNGTDNTFATALGLKKAKGWRKVDHQFRKDIEALTLRDEPLLLYNGAVQKMVPVFFKEFAFLSDKVEHPNVTSTIGHGSDTHRCFGVSGKITTPAVKADQLRVFLSKQVSGSSVAFGWCDQFISNACKRNGARFPACYRCRKKGLKKLGISFPNRGSNNHEGSCSNCANWDLLTSNTGLLEFPLHPNYPRKCTEGSPVPPPDGRDVFDGSEVKLRFVKFDWEFMKQACKFMVYQASRSKGSWNKEESVCYLTYCGVSPKISGLLYTLARVWAKEKGAQQDYSSDNCIGELTFPAPWCSKGLTLCDFIETIMHILFLGVCESNMELVTMWLSQLPSSSGIGSSPFRAVLQELIKDLRPFMLSWLLAYPLTGKKGSLGTGSWVSENWGFLVRVSPLVFAWCAANHTKASKYGVDDMSRMTIAFHAFVARCLTHNGVDDAFIAETHLYLNEFLSAVREFDIRVRYTKFDSPEKAKAKEQAQKENALNKKQKAKQKGKETTAHPDGQSTEEKKKQTPPLKDPKAWWLKPTTCPSATFCQ